MTSSGSGSGERKREGGREGEEEGESVRRVVNGFHPSIRSIGIYSRYLILSIYSVYTHIYICGVYVPGTF